MPLLQVCPTPLPPHKGRERIAPNGSLEGLRTVLKGKTLRWRVEKD